MANPILHKLTRPVMAGTTGLHANKTGRELLKERKQLRPPQSLIEGDFAILTYAVDLKDVLGQIEADCCNLHGVAPLKSSR
jgi:hypothetical protein